MRVKEESVKVGLKVNIKKKKKKLRSWYPVPSLKSKKMRGKSGNSGGFYFLGLQIHFGW